MAFLNISGININNDHLVNEIAGIAGFANSVERADLCSAQINIHDSSFCAKAGIKKSEVNEMIASFVIAGFDVKYVD